MRTLLLPSILAAATATAGESQIHLMDGPGQYEVAAQCGICHSLDYVTMHAGILDQAGWEKTVDKMIRVMDAPIGADDRQGIVEYLVRHYGK